MINATVNKGHVEVKVEAENKEQTLTELTLLCKEVIDRLPENKVKTYKTFISALMLASIL